jgi:hypothetical protein
MRQPTAVAIENHGQRSLPVVCLEGPAQREDERSGTRVYGLRVVLAAALLGLASLSPAADAMSDRLNAQTSFDMPAQPLGLSLKQLAAQADIQIFFEEQVVSGLRAPAVKAQETPLQALNALLKGTGLEFVAKDATIAIRKKSLATTSSDSGRDSPGSAGGIDQQYRLGGSAAQSTDPSRGLSSGKFCFILGAGNIPGFCCEYGHPPE